MEPSEWQARQKKPRPNVAYEEKCFERAVCLTCGQVIPMGTVAIWYDRRAWHRDCRPELLEPKQKSLF